jgi:hypothetical protein
MRYDDEVGYDLGIMLLPPFYRRLAEANGVVPLTFDAWPTSRRAMDLFYELGVPRETIAQTDSFQKGVVLLELDAVEPEQIPLVVQKRFERHHFRVKDDLAAVEIPLTTIEGMSGGPVFGMEWIGEDLRYWLIGLQSSWEPKSQVVAVFPADHRLRQALLNILELLRKSPSDEQPPSS